jgi:nicotinate-nucleotide adenylyltransferase
VVGTDASGAARLRIGVLGGSFNPIHHAHLRAAEEAAAALALDRVLLVPAAQSPLKRSAPVAPADRLAMAELAVQGNPLLAVSRVDIEREPPSYTVDTLAIVQRAHPHAELFLILGIDALQDLLDWREPRRLLELAQLVVVSRPGYALEIPREIVQRLSALVGRINLLPMPLLEISSSDIRRRIRCRKPVRYLLPDSVERYIREKLLYQVA